MEQVVTRKLHTCSYCTKLIPAGSKVETFVTPYRKGIKTIRGYICTECSAHIKFTKYTRCSQYNMYNKVELKRNKQADPYKELESLYERGEISATEYQQEFDALISNEALLDAEGIGQE